MKKLALLMLALVVVLPAFADDAKVMPAGVLRTYVIMAYNSFTESYDNDGKLQDAYLGGVTALNFGGALEFGVTDQITAAFQWAPGYTVYSEFADPFDLDGGAGALPSNDKANANGINDLFIGAKIQILGSQGFIPNDSMRLAAALGIVVPLADPDFEEAFTDYSNGDAFTLSASSKEAFGYGFRLYYDYLFNENFFINLYNETIFYSSVEKDIFYPAGTQKYEYGYDATFEIEPQYEYQLNDLVKLTAGLPLTYTMSPAYKVDGTEVADSETSLLKIAPSISAFLRTTLPVEFKLGYGLPLMGTNDNASSTLTAQIRVYAKFY